MSHIFDEINLYTQIESADKIQYFDDCKSAIYMWYFPIKFRVKSGDINSANNHFYNHDLQIYDRATQIVIEDNRRKLKGIVSLFNPNKIHEIPLSNNHPNDTSQIIANTLLGLSALSNPIYIGKATREDDVKKRIKEHINLNTTFGTSLSKVLEESDYSINDMIIRVINIEKLINDKLLGSFKDDFDFAEYLERILINLFKPVFNIRN